MRRLAILIAPVALVGTTEPEIAIDPASPFDNPAFETPETPWEKMPDAPAPDSGFCADRVREARASAGLPAMDRRTASPERPELIYAVDHRRDGCGVLVMHGNSEDIRPVPEAGNEGGIIPAEAGAD